MKKLFTTVLMMVMVLGMSTGLQASKKSRQAYVDKYGMWLTQQVRDCILNKKICMGMSTSEVVASWGKPEDINVSVGSWGRHEQWVYGRTYVYFETHRDSGSILKVTSWQQ